VTFNACKILTAVTVLIGLAAPVFSQDKIDPNVDGTASGVPGGVAKYTMAQGLYAIGRENKDALLALTAAKLVAGIEMTDVERKVMQNPGPGVTEEADVVDVPAGLATMLASAREFAAGDEMLLGLIDEVEAESARDRIGGASRQLSRLPAGAIDVWKIPFYGNAYAEIGVSGEGDAPLSVVVTEENGNRVGCPALVYDTFYCDFVPRWNGYFNVTIANQGRKQNSYFILTN
jgi:hypothetical protein